MQRITQVLVFVFILAGLTACAQQAQPAQQPAPTPAAPAQEAAPTEAPPVPTEAAPAPTETAPAPEPTSEAGASSESAPTLTIGMPVGPRLLDPDDHTPMSQTIYDLLYNRLVRLGPDGRLQPDLATSWEIVDPTTWRFHLREGVTFHNGEEFDAEAVKFTIEWNMNPEQNRMALARGVHDVASVSVVDKYTADIVTKQPVGTLASFLTVVYILPSEHYTTVGAQEFNNAPVGTGPFRFVEWRRDEYITLEANENYWEGRPKLDRVEIKVIPEDAARTAALRAGEVDLIVQIPPEQADTLKQEGFTVEPVGIGQSYCYGFGRETQRLEPLQDVQVRQAIQYAVDKEAIVEAITGGYAKKLEGQMASPSAFGHNPDVKAFPYDPQKARELLAEAGYADGFSLPIKASAGRYFKDKETTEALVAYLAEVGITAEVEFLEPAVWAERYLANQLDEGGMWNCGWNLLPAMDVVISYPHFTCESPREIWCNERFDELYKQQNVETDAEKRLTLLHEMAQVVHDEAIMLYLYQIPFIYAYDPGVSNVRFLENGTMNLMEATVSR